MKLRRARASTSRVLLAALVIAGSAGVARAHCDGMDGPVVKAAQAALEEANVNLVLQWVRAADEPEIRSAFDRAITVRKLGSDAQKLADSYFFETVVRVHRTGEGAPYTGLKPAGRDLGPAIPAADRALASGDPEPLVKLLVEAVRAGVHERFQSVLAVKSHAPADVGAGREFVERYVAYVHYVERAYQDASGAAGSHDAEGGASGAPHHHEE